MKGTLILSTIMIFSLIFISCGSSGKGELSQSTAGSNPKIEENHKKAHEILEKLIVAEKRFGVTYGRYAEIAELREKGLFTIDDLSISDAGYKVRVVFKGVKMFKIYMNPLEYKITGIISFFGDQSSMIRGGDHGGGDGGGEDPEI